jgi:peptidoglycan-associated lipoprotein
MKKLVLTIAMMSLVTSCSLFKKKTDGADAGAGSQVLSQTTGGGGTEKIDATPMKMSATGSDSGTIDGLQTVRFDYDKATIAAAEKAKLTGNAAWMQKNSSSKMLIEGHCDQRGSTEYNLSLGERRANAVKQMMVSQGISASRITTVSFGKEKLLSESDSADEMAKNRRANFVPTVQ